MNNRDSENTHPYEEMPEEEPVIEEYDQIDQSKIDILKKKLFSYTKTELLELIENNQGDFYLIMIGLQQTLTEIKKPGIQYFAILNISTIILTWLSKNALKLYSFLYDTDEKGLADKKMPKRRKIAIWVCKLIQMGSIASFGISQFIFQKTSSTKQDD